MRSQHTRDCSAAPAIAVLADFIPSRIEEKIVGFARKKPDRIDACIWTCKS